MGWTLWSGTSWEFGVWVLEFLFLTFAVRTHSSCVRSIFALVSGSALVMCFAMWLMLLVFHLFLPCFLQGG